MASRRVHIVGAGIAGLAAALQLVLADEAVTLYEAAPFAGGRCRSFHDRELDCRIDNGSHLVLSGNAALYDYLFLTEALETMGGPGQPIFPFLDRRSGERWTVSLNKGPLPYWIADKKRRIPGVPLRDYKSVASMMLAGGAERVIERVDIASALYRRFWEPLTIGVLNTEPEIASAALLANVMRQTFAVGGEACIPLIPKLGLSETFIDPCLGVLQQHNAEIMYNHRLGAMKETQRGTRLALSELHFNNGTIVEVGPDDWVILALPAWVIKNLMPEIAVPNDFRSIVNAHFRVDNLVDPVGLTGIVGGLAEWIFVRNGVVSATVSCAERYGDYPVRDMVSYIWRDIAALHDFDPDALPPYRIFKEKFATFAATPEQNARRPNAYIGWANLALAGEWTATGLPSTIEGAIRSGMKAAQIVKRWD